MTRKEFGDTHQQHQAWAEKMDECRRRAAIRASQEEAIAAKTQMDMQKIVAGDESRAALIQAAAKPKCNRNDCMRDALPGTTGLCPDHYQQYVDERVKVGDRVWFRHTGRILRGAVRRVGADHVEVVSIDLGALDRLEIPLDQKGTHWEFSPLPLSECLQKEKLNSQILQEPDDPRPWFSRRCTEEGCKMDGHEDYGFLCRDHYYERKHDAAATIWTIGNKVKAAVALVIGSILSLLAVAGAYTGQMHLPIIFGVGYVLFVGLLWSDLGLSRDWKWKRANKPRIPTKGAAKTQPFTLPSVEQP